MTMRVTRQAIQRNIRAAADAGLAVFGIAPDGTVLTSKPDGLPIYQDGEAKPAAANSCDDILNRLMGSD